VASVSSKRPFCSLRSGRPRSPLIRPGKTLTCGLWPTVSSPLLWNPPLGESHFTIHRRSEVDAGAGASGDRTTPILGGACVLAGYVRAPMARRQKCHQGQNGRTGGCTERDSRVLAVALGPVRCRAEHCGLQSSCWMMPSPGPQGDASAAGADEIAAVTRVGISDPTAWGRRRCGRSSAAPESSGGTRAASSFISSRVIGPSVVSWLCPRCGHHVGSTAGAGPATAAAGPQAWTTNFFCGPW